MSPFPALPTRSLLFVPANRPDRFEKAWNSGADIVCVDLEDAVQPGDKAAARPLVAQFFKAAHPAETRGALRINSLSCLDGIRDILLLAEHAIRPDFLLLPKTSGASEVRNLVALLREMALDCPVLAIIESAEGLDNASEIALTTGVAGICLGSADYSAETGSSMDWDALIYARGRLVQAAARAGVLALDGAWLAISDPDGLSAESRRLPGLGFDGRVVIHPSQIDAVHAAFAPSPADVDRAGKILTAVSSTGGSAVAVDGRMVDRPVILWAERVLARARPSRGIS